MNRPSVYAAVGAALVVIVLLFSGRPAPQPVTTVSNFEAAADNPATVAARKEIQAVQRQFQDAVKREDLPAVLSFMTPDFIQVTLDGSRVNRKQAEEAMKQSWPKVQAIEKWKLELADFTLKGDTATGVVRETLVARIKEGGTVRTQNTTGNSRNTWVRTPKGWKYKRMVELPAGEGTLGNTEYVSRDEWLKESRSRQTADRRRANIEKDQAAAVKTEKPITKAEARRMLEKQYADFRTAIRRKNADAAMKMLSDNYTVEYPDYSQPRVAVETGMRRELKAMQSIPAWTQDIGGITIEGNVVTATVVDRRSTIFLDPKRKQHRVSMVVSMRDTWVRTRDGWKNSQTEMTSITQTIDGRTRKVF